MEPLEVRMKETTPGWLLHILLAGAALLIAVVCLFSYTEALSVKPLFFGLAVWSLTTMILLFVGGPKANHYLCLLYTWVAVGSLVGVFVTIATNSMTLALFWLTLSILCVGVAISASIGSAVTPKETADSLKADITNFLEKILIRKAKDS